jgi:hypothetical protein
MGATGEGLRMIFGLPRALAVLAVLALLVPRVATAQSVPGENRSQVERLNAFADDLLAIVARWKASGRVETSARMGGYARMPDYFREETYKDAASGRVLARVRWVAGQPDTAHMIEVFLHDGGGNLVADYYASYLVEHRNAPMHALVNLHASEGELRAFRQYDIFGELLFERCQGRFGGEAVDLSIDAFDPEFSKDSLPEGLYAACFAALPDAPGAFALPSAQFRETGAQ